MQPAESISIAAPPEAVWRVLIDIERWPEWTASMTKLERLQPGELVAGARVRVTQPKLPANVYNVTRVEPERCLEWRLTRPGLSIVAGHRIEPEDAGSKVTLTVEQSGLLSPIVSLIYGRLTRRYVAMEAQGLKQRAEGKR